MIRTGKTEVGRRKTEDGSRKTEVRSSELRSKAMKFRATEREDMRKSAGKQDV